MYINISFTDFKWKFLMSQEFWYLLGKIVKECKKTFDKMKGKEFAHRVADV